MSYDIHLNFSENSAEGKAIALLVEEGQVSPQDAAKQLIREAISASSQGSVVKEALQKVERVRADRARELAAQSIRNESAGRLIGFLKDEPEMVEAIREAS